MKTTKIIGLFVLAVAVSSARADTLSDNFDGGISPALWTPYQMFWTPAGESDASGLWTISAPDAQGRLAISKPADTGGLNYSTGAGLHSVFTLDGDFRVSVAFALVSFPPPWRGYNESLLEVVTEGGDRFASLQFGIGSNIMDYICAEGYSSIGDTPVGSMGSSSAFGHYEIRRDGNTMSALFDDGSGLVLLGTLSDPGFAGPVHVNLYGAQIVNPTGYRPFTDLDVRFDGFSATADTVVLPEPATLSLLALGGLVALRRRR
jgi:hypothetical protein